jgi:CelD/BcsL family acetyltransferase involved in cellulose biosynthesis
MSTARNRHSDVPAVRSQEYRIAVVTGREDLHALRAEWTDLLLDSRDPNVFMSWEWMTAWQQEYRGRGRPHVLLARRAQDGFLVGLAPLYETATRAPLALRSMGFMGTGVGADHLAFILRRDEETSVFGALSAYMLSTQGWDALDFPRMEEETARRLGDAVSRSGRGRLARSSELADLCPYIALPGTWEAYLRTLSSNARKDLGRRSRRLQEQGDVVIQRVQDVGELDSAWEIFFRLHRERRQAVGGRSAFMADRTWAFHRAFMRTAAERGWLRLYLMKVGDQYVAAEYCVHFGGRVSDLQCGFDMRWSRYGVGTLLVAHAIREAIAEGATEYDLLRGGEEYKQQRWAASLRKDVSLLIWRRQPRVAMLIAARRCATKMKAHLRRRLASHHRPDPAADREVPA